jgi:hypothetical protein
MGTCKSTAVVRDEPNIVSDSQFERIKTEWFRQLCADKRRYSPERLLSDEVDFDPAKAYLKYQQMCSVHGRIGTKREFNECIHQTLSTQSAIEERWAHRRFNSISCN